MCNCKDGIIKKLIWNHFLNNTKLLRLGHEQNKILNFFTLEIFLDFFHVKST